MAEIDALYFEYERALSTELRESNFALALAGLAIGGAGSIAREGASQRLSATSAGLTGARDAFQKEVLMNGQRRPSCPRCVLREIWKNKTSC